MVRAVGDKQTRTIRPDFDRSISIDFQGAKITSDTGFLLMREIDQRFNILSAAASQVDDPRSRRHTDHSLLYLADAKSIRPLQWSKNLLVFVPIITSGAIHDSHAILRAFFVRVLPIRIEIVQIIYDVRCGSYAAESNEH